MEHASISYLCRDGRVVIELELWEVDSFDERFHSWVGKRTDLFPWTEFNFRRSKQFDQLRRKTTRKYSFVEHFPIKEMTGWRNKNAFSKISTIESFPKQQIIKNFRIWYVSFLKIANCYSDYSYRIVLSRAFLCRISFPLWLVSLAAAPNCSRMPFWPADFRVFLVRRFCPGPSQRSNRHYGSSTNDGQ